MYERGLAMKHIEFAAHVKDGIIKIPKRYLPNLEGVSFKITIEVPETKLAKKKPSLREKFKAISLDTRGFKFNRNEANER